MNRKITILGAKESGIGAALLAQQKGYSVFVSDFGCIEDSYKKILNTEGISYEEEKHTEALILDSDWVIKSPGIPKKASILKKIEEKGIEISSEIEMASRFAQAPIIAITGSNGKTTTTTLIHHILTQAGLMAHLVGNIGTSFAKSVAKQEVPDYYIAEISSFQLDDIQQFKPHIALVLNITPDHLDQYDNDILKYAEAKWNITQNQTSNDYLIIGYDDEYLQKLQNLKPSKAQILPFSLHEKLELGAFSDTQNININLTNNSFNMKIQDLALLGKHNVANSMAAATTAKLINIKNKEIQMSLTDFDSVEHRLEPVMKIQGIKFINDSKATNVNAVYYALECMETPTVLIMGGVDKGNDYSEITELVKSKVKALVCLGTDNSALIKAFGEEVPAIVEAKNMGEAVRAAYMFARKNDTVLLSPACASFDLFNNYEDRGNQFKEEVRKL